MDVCPFICVFVPVYLRNYTQTLQDLSSGDLCALAIHLGIDYCAPFFRQQNVDGEEMMFYKKQEFLSRLKTSTGEICISVTYCTVFCFNC